MAKDDDILDEAQEAFKLASDNEIENRKEALADLKFARLSEQWSSDDKTRRGTNRPTLTINKLPAFIRQVVNDARQNKPSIKVRPVDDIADVHTAQVMNGIIRNIETSSNADVAYDTAADCAVTMGFGYFRVDLDYSHDDTFDQDLLIKAVPNPFSVYGDPNSTAADSSDWNSAFVTEWMAVDVFKARYPKADEVNWDDTGTAVMGPNWRTEESVMICEWWKREEVQRTVLLLDIPGQAPLTLADDVYEEQKEFLDLLGATVRRQRKVLSYKVTHYLMTGAEVLETTEWPGRYVPIVPVYGEEVNVEGTRKFRSLIRDAKDPQRMVNYWRTTATELVALAPRAPWIGPERAFSGEDSEKWATANTETHAFLSYPDNSPGPPQRTEFAGVPAGALQEALNANDDIKAVIGLYDASLGARSNETSGKAIDARKREGDVSTFHFIDNLSRGIRCGGKILIDLIPHVYTAGRVVRILGPEGQIATATLGSRNASPPPLAAPMAGGPPLPSPAAGMGSAVQPPGLAPNSAPGGMAQPPSGLPLGPGGAPPAGLPPGQGPLQSDPNSPAPWPPQPPDGTTGIFDLTMGKYDLVVDVGPSYTTRRAETADQMMKLIQAYPPVAPLIGDLIAKNLDWPGAQEIADRLVKMLPPQLQKGPDGQPLPPQPPPEIMAMQAKQQAEDQRAMMKGAAEGKQAQQQMLADAMTKLIIAKIQAGAGIEEARIKAGMDLQTTLADSLMQIFADAQMQGVQPGSVPQTPAGAPAGPGAQPPPPGMATPTRLADASAQRVAMPPGPAGGIPMMPPSNGQMPPNGPLQQSAGMVSSIRVEHGDSRDVIKTLADASIDACVTDPPYSLVSIGKRFGRSNMESGEEQPPNRGAQYKRLSRGFMGKQWDTGETAFDPAFWAEVLRVMKPGAHLVAFGGCRTYHRLVCAIEDAGFEIRDQIGWVFSQGFPKSHNVSKGIDKAAGAQREVIGRAIYGDGHMQNSGESMGYGGCDPVADMRNVTAPATDAARQWQGWGTALKPAWEPICLARKPLIGTVAANVLAHGTGALNIDASRIPTNGETIEPVFAGRKGPANGGKYGNSGDYLSNVSPLGRWPANLIHDGSAEVLAGFPDTGIAQSGGRSTGRNFGQEADDEFAKDRDRTGHDDLGGSAARFFYTAKADAGDRLFSKHPTVKPVDLMAYLCRLVTPPGGTVLDPFAGSGSTGMACMREGFDCIMIEREAEYVADIRYRLEHVDGSDMPLFAAPAMAPDKPAQLPLFDGYADAAE